ncbi:YdcF family protein [Salisaeta longa]|uniref:YdcF family protein n=1 Tax=Salisaeta longa TaxID=503170 RepID=UPI0003B42B4C|nr:YdcF family protein [Salisaeta longa]
MGSLYLSKVLTLLLYPLTWSLLAVLGGGLWALRAPRWGLGVVFAGGLLLYVTALPVVSTALRRSLEQQHPPQPIAATPSADAIVVLGGGIAAAHPPRLYPDLNSAADRVLHAARLYKAGHAPCIIASGGAVPWHQQSEAPAMEIVLQQLGVPPRDVILEAESRSTYENAQHTAQLARRTGRDTLLLVTSALHMRRALATFRSTGLVVHPAPTDYEAVERSDTVLAFLPDAAALAGTTAALKEYAGYAVYRWRGWIAAPPHSSSN